MHSLNTLGVEQPTLGIAQFRECREEGQFASYRIRGNFEESSRMLKLTWIKCKRFLEIFLKNGGKINIVISTLFIDSNPFFFNSFIAFFHYFCYIRA